jgi:predicted glycoside hydrolase/deacetylase ChbG (UPF0249 family)
MNSVFRLQSFVAVGFATLLSASPCCGQISLLVRGDDMGSTHAANVACIESYKNGIMRSVELMPVGPWFLEATQMLKDNPDLDVGIHLALTSEWSRYKWRPLTHCPSLVDPDGYFFSMVWPNRNFAANSSLQESSWKIDEIEHELRAQVELALKYVPQISHMGGHMGFAGLDPEIGALMDRLAKEYKLDIDTSKHELQRFNGWKGVETYEERIEAFCNNLEKLKPGKYLFVEHPAFDCPEMRPIGHVGYETVAKDREWVTRVFTSDKVKQAIKDNGIELISYGDLKR